MIKNPPANAGDVRDEGSVLGWGRSPGVGNGNHLQYFSLGNPINRGAWQATVHGVTKSQTQLSDYHSLCEENYKTLMRETREELNKQRFHVHG